MSIKLKEFSYNFYRDFNIKILILENLKLFKLTCVKQFDDPSVLDVSNLNSVPIDSLNIIHEG